MATHTKLLHTFWLHEEVLGNHFQDFVNHTVLYWRVISGFLSKQPEDLLNAENAIIFKPTDTD